MSLSLSLGVTATIQAQDAHDPYAEQERIVDSLANVIMAAKHDTTRCYAYILIGEEVYVHDPDTALVLFQAARKLADAGLKPGLPTLLEERYVFLLGEALNDIGYILEARGQVEEGLENYHQSLKMSQQLQRSDNKSVAEEAKYAVATSLNNIGVVYDDQGDFTSGLEYHQRSLAMRKDLGDQYGISESLHNIGYVYDERGDFDKALEYYLQSLAICEELDDIRGVANSMNAIGGIYIEQGFEDSALVFFKRGLKIEQEMGNIGGVSLLSNNMAAIYLHQGDIVLAKEHAFRSMAIAEELGFPVRIGNAASRLYQIFSAEENYEQALEMYELHIQMRDSLKNEETKKATIRQQTKYEFEKNQLVKEQEQKEAARVEAESLSRRDNLQYSVVFICLLGIGILIAFLGKLSLSERVAEGLIFFAFLIFFEFILVLADPYIDNWTGGAPGLKLLINAFVAALIFPLHSLIERKLKGRLMARKQSRY